MDIEKLDRRIYRFLATIFKLLPKEAKPAFIQSAAKAFDVNSAQLLYRLSREVQVNGEGVDASSSLPNCVLMDLKEANTQAAVVERKKLEVLTQLVLDGEDPEYLLQLAEERVINYCRSCKLLEYERDFYMNHNIKDEIGRYTCLSCYYVQ